MPSFFPELLNFPILATLILRLTAGIYFAMLAVRLSTTLRTIPNPALSVRVLGTVFVVCEYVVAGLLFVGFYTQVAALGGMALAVVSLTLGIGRGSHASERHVQVLLLVICASLLFLGAGPFAFDIPL